jgi:hypothetical protein
MMEMAKRNINTELDWNALDRSWAEQYPEDYGNLFHIGFKLDFATYG